ncbi:MAG TPA: hypothetical protein VK137_01910, partial [Planctomycetaceae bacterium]|nr:hypothetical protein [Planctomycetaceae bacterium]
SKTASKHQKHPPPNVASRVGEPEVVAVMMISDCQEARPNVLSWMPSTLGSFSLDRHSPS